MASVWLDPPVEEQIGGVRARPTLAKLMAAIDRALDLLEDPGAAEVRAHRFTDGQWMYRFPVPGGDRWMVIWWERDDPGHEGEPYVTYIGPIFEA